MRTMVVLALAALSLNGCSSFRDMFSAHANVAVEVGDQALSAEQLADMMVKAKGVRLTRESAEMVAKIWLDYTLFAQAVARGELVNDSAGIAEALWPEIAELKGTYWYDTLAARRTPVGTAAVDSAYAADEARALQHILFSVSPNDPQETRTAALRKAESTLKQVRAGADFGTLAERLSQDPGSQRNRGLYPPAPRGQYVTAFDSAGWRLAPGEVSGVVETPYGYHIIRRPPVDQVRDVWADWLARQTTRVLDSAYMEDLAKANDLKVTSGAAKLMRAAVADQEGMRSSRKALVKYSGGAFTAGDFLRWMSTPALAPYAAQFNQVTDEQVEQLAKALATNSLLLRQADSAGIRLTPLEWEALQHSFRASVDTLRQTIGLDYDVTDSSVAAAERSKVAALKVEQFFAGLMEGKARYRPLPSSLGLILRDRSDYEINPAGIALAVELGLAKQGADTAAKPPAPGPMAPAPGPPPVPQQPGQGTAPSPAAPAPGR